jgi:hypothetical protein
LLLRRPGRRRDLRFLVPTEEEVSLAKSLQAAEQKLMAPTSLSPSEIKYLTGAPDHVFGKKVMVFPHQVIPKGQAGGNVYFLKARGAP